jgi:hypothetical protein
MDIESNSLDHQPILQTKAIHMDIERAVLVIANQ